MQNNATILITPNDSNDIIGISIKAKGGEFIEKIPGTGNLTADLMLKDTKNYSALQLTKIMEDNGIKILPSSNADTFNINALTTKNEYKKTDMFHIIWLR